MTENTAPSDNSKDAPDKHVTKPRPIRRKQDDPLYRAASDIAISAACYRDKQKPFRDEDDMLEYTRELRSDLHEQMQDERYGSRSHYRY